MNNKYIGIIIGIIAIITVSWWIIGNKVTTKTPKGESGPVTTMPYPASTQQGGTPSHEMMVTQTVVYTNDGFSPSELTVKAGTTVNFINQSDSLMWVASNPHPTHTLYAEFDEEASVAKGGSYSFLFEKIGTHPYHNHFNPGKNGKVTVE